MTAIVVVAADANGKAFYASVDSVRFLSIPHFPATSNEVEYLLSCTEAPAWELDELTAYYHGKVNVLSLGGWR